MSALESPGNFIQALPAHLETVLGPIQFGWANPESSIDVQVVRFVNSPREHITSYATLGLSKYPLRQTSGKVIRQELLTSCEGSKFESVIVNALCDVVEQTVTNSSPLKLGQIVASPRLVARGATPSAFFCTQPTPFSSELTEFEQGELPLVFVYLIAVLPDEVRQLSERGWSWFEEQLEAQDPNIWDLSRKDGIKSE
jgi:antitoxin YqcF